jgi:two-component system CheB/CheR fusion protein
MTKVKKTRRASRRSEQLRRRAEARLKKSPQAASPTSVEDARNLVHELQVHQAELEIQNEELRRVQLELEDSRDRFARLYDFAPVGYLTLDAEGVIHEANLTAARLVGLDRRALVKKKLSRFVAAQSQDDFYLHRQQVFANAGLQTSDLQMRRPDGAAFSGRLESVVEAAGPGQPAQCLVALSDVTQRLRGAEVLRQSEANYRSLFELNPAPMWICDESTLEFLDVNEAALKLYGWSHSEFLRMTAKDIRPPEDMPEFVRKVKQQRGSRAAFVGERRHLKRDGSVFDVAVTISSIPYAGRAARLVVVNDITTPKQAEAASRVSQERLALAASGTRIGMFDWDVVTGNMLWTEQHARLLGPTTTTTTLSLRYTYHDWARRVHPEDLPRIEAELRRCMAKHAPFEAEYRVVWPDQSVHWIVGRGVFQYDPKRQPQRMLGIIMDSTARKRTEEALQESEDRYRRLFEDDLTGDFLATPAGKVLLCNPAFVKIYGFPSRRRAERGNVARFNPPDWARVVEGLRARGKIDGHETWHKSADGRQIHIVENLVGLFNAQKELIQVKGYVFDNTERKLAEELLKQLNATLERRVTERTQELQDAYERHRAITDNALVGILTLNERGLVETLNPAAVQIFGYSPEELAGRNVSQLMASPDQARGEEFLAHYMQPGDQRFMGVGREVLGRRKDGHGIMLELTVSDFTQGGRRQYLAMLRDITQRKRLERELLDVSERERQQLGRDLHDGLGQHLHGLGYLVELLEQNLRQAASPRAAEAGQLSKYLHEALEMTRSLARGLQPVDAEPQGLMLALRELAERIRGVYRVDCRFECRSPVLIHQHISANHLYRIAQEAVNNAMKHGKPTRVRIQLKATPARIILGVRDNGVGIRRRAKPGRGMGLHVMQYRADAVGGSLLVQRHPEGGTDVVCTIPRQALLPQEDDIK